MTAALQALLERVEAGDRHGLNRTMAQIGHPSEAWPWDWMSRIDSAFHGSLDAAKALHEAVLPGWIVVQMCQLLEVDAGFNYTGKTDGWLVEISQITASELEGSGTAQDPARAWLIAIIRALIAAADTEDGQ